MTHPVHEAQRAITEQIANLREAAEKATPGPWEVADPATIPADEGGKVLGPQETTSRGHPVRYFVAQFVLGHDTAYIALANPATILALLDHLASETARAEAAEARIQNIEGDRDAADWDRAHAQIRVATLERQLAEAREALEPFSKYAGIVFERNFNNSDPVDSMTASDGGQVTLHAEDFFRARATYAALTTKGTGQ